MNTPNQRGSLSGRSPFIKRVVDEDSNTDWHPHFPAGPKKPIAGNGIRSQKNAAGRPGWVPFEPLKRSYTWRAGVCGDAKTGTQKHLKGGEYYNDGKIAGRYKQGGIIDVGVSVNAHHNGFMELFICNVAKCPGGEISETCFRRGFCKQLQRARNKRCDSGWSKACAPIDRKYPGRWYLPCSRYPLIDEKMEQFGLGTIQYRLPKRLRCSHCVILWYWVSANICNPPGVIDYFDGPDRPRNWGQCKGQGGALGGVARNQRPCGGRIFTEEYYQCADISILSKYKWAKKQPKNNPPRRKPQSRNPPSRKPSKKNPPSRKNNKPRRKNNKNNKPRWKNKPPSKKPGNPTYPKAPSKRENGSSRKPKAPKKCPYNLQNGLARGQKGIRDIVLVANGCRIRSLNGVSYVNIKAYKSVTVEAITESNVKSVTFRVDGVFVNTDSRAPFYINGGKGKKIRHWAGAVVNRRMTITASANGDNDPVTIMWVK